MEGGRGHADPAHQSRGDANHLVAEEILGLLPFYRKHKDKFDRASRKYQLFTLYQIRNKRMNWRTLLTLLSVRNGKRLADGLRGNNVSGRLPR